MDKVLGAGQVLIGQGPKWRSIGRPDLVTRCLDEEIAYD
jgi:hypothetical protein